MTPRVIATLFMSLFTLATCDACVGRWQAWNTPARTVDAQREAAVQVMVYCPGEVGKDGRVMQHWGSGVAVSPWTVITAAHVVACSNGVGLASQGDGLLKAVRVELLDRRHDLARLVIMSGPGFKIRGTVRLAHTFPERQVCVATGMPTRDYRCGIVDEVKDWPTANVFTGMVVEPGNSGSGVYDRHGRLVCILTHQRRTKEGTAYGSLCVSVADKAQEVLP